MGNYMNQGNQRVGEAAGFKISFLAQVMSKKNNQQIMKLLVKHLAMYLQVQDTMHSNINTII